MFGLHQVAPDLVQITLPSPSGWPLPWGRPPALYLVGSSGNTLIDTGFHSTEDALLAALAACGRSPQSIQRVVLTGLEPATLGNLHLFPEASVFSAGCGAGPSGEVNLDRLHQPVVERLDRLGKQLWEGADLPPSWDPEAIPAFLSRWRRAVAHTLTILELDEGERLGLPGGGALEAVEAPGACVAGLALFDSEGRLFTGRTATFTGYPQPRNAAEYLQTLDRLGKVGPGLICPGAGGVERHPPAAFRALGLLSNGALTNLPYLFAGQTSLGELLYHDLGGWPSCPVRTLARLAALDAWVRELVRAGIVLRDADHVWSPMVGGNAQGRRAPGLVSQVRAWRANREPLP